MGKCTLSGIHPNYCWAFPLFSPRRVPLPILGKLEKEITRLTLLDVIESVEEPTEWCAPIVVVLKPNGDIRMCFDLTK